MTRNMCATKEKISRENSVIRTRRYLKLGIKQDRRYSDPKARKDYR